jgi:hypothetical protein
MEIDALTLLAYAIIWTVFYFFLSNYIAELSRKKWTTWVQSEESDDILVEALQAVIEEIEIRMHEKLEAFQTHFQKSFFGSVGNMTKKAQNLDPMNNLRKAAKDGDWTSMVVEYAANKAGLGSLIAQNSTETAPNTTKSAPKKVKFGLK